MTSRAAPIEAAFPGTVIDGAVDRAKLGAAVLGKPEALHRLEAIIHPLVREEEARPVHRQFTLLDGGDLIDPDTGEVF